MRQVLYGEVSIVVVFVVSFVVARVEVVVVVVATTVTWGSWAKGSADLAI
jgi:hypothetical protein